MLCHIQVRNYTIIETAEEETLLSHLCKKILIFVQVNVLSHTELVKLCTKF